MSGLVLIACSKEPTARVVETALKEDQLNCLIARDGLQALDLALDRAPNAVFLCADLPKVNGIGVGRALRALVPTEHIPIIFLAENEAEAKKIVQEELPFTECLTAPFQSQEIKTRAAHMLRHANRILELRQRDKAPEPYVINDPLTHVYQRRYTVNRLTYEASRSARYKNPLSVLLVDVGNLKEINHEYGILVGDSVLIEAAQMLYKAARRTDIIGRYDTQDFIVILPETNETGALNLANRVSQLMSKHKFLNGKLDLNVTVSVGVSGAAGSDLSENLALIGRAATALDQAKRAGNNRVEKG